MSGRTPIVMVSSTFRDLEAERKIAEKIIREHLMQPKMMERKKSVPDRTVLTDSRRMVQDADVYLLLLGNYYYGQVIPDPELNPDNLSVTELEYRWAQEKGIPIFRFRRKWNARINETPSDYDEMVRDRPRLRAFVDRVRNDGLAPEFASRKELREIVDRSLREWRLEQVTTPAPSGTTPTPPIPTPGACIGRDADVDAVLSALTPGNAVLVHGPGGIGKTTITRHVAHLPSITARFPGRIWEAELETARDRDTFDAQVLTGLGLLPSQGFAAAIQRLSQAPSLLVLDNLETAWDGDRTGIEARLAQLAAVPGLTLLASFRGHEPVRGASWTRVPIEPLPQDDAWTLFRHHAPHIPDTDPDRAALMAALGGVPLAICLIAMRALHHDSLARLWQDWQRLGAEAAQVPSTRPDRLTSVTVSIEVSLASSRMTVPARRLFAILGQCPAGLAEADSMTLLGPDSLAAEEALLGLGLAYRREGRIDLLPPVREHAARAHRPEGDDATAWCRHFLDRVQREGGRIWWEGGAEARDALTPEIPNIDVALRAAPTLGLRQDAVVAANGMGLLLSASGAGSPAVLDTLAQACEAAGDRSGQAECLYRYGAVAYDRSDHDTAHCAQLAAAALYDDLNMPQGEANCIQTLGDIALDRSDHDGARARFQEALPLFRRVGDVLGEANCIRRLGDIALRRSDHDGARARYQKALPLYRRVGDVVGEANCVLSQGRVAAAAGDKAAAKACYAQALTLYERVHRVENIALAHTDLADVTEGEERARHIAAAAAAWRSMGLEDKAARVERRFGDDATS